jgi:hypothetical protein
MKTLTNHTLFIIPQQPLPLADVWPRTEPTGHATFYRISITSDSQQGGDSLKTSLALKWTKQFIRCRANVESSNQTLTSLNSGRHCPTDNVCGRSETTRQMTLQSQSQTQTVGCMTLAMSRSVWWQAGNGTGSHVLHPGGGGWSIELWELLC